MPISLMQLRGACRAAALTSVWLLLSGCSLLGNMFVEPRVESPASAAVAAASEIDNVMARGKANFAAGRYGVALGQFEQVLAEQPESVRALNAIAATYDQLRNFDLAQQYYDRALR